jgi:uncharacterized protein involved in exopolysaccharide biosynthesis
MMAEYQPQNAGRSDGEDEGGGLDLEKISGYARFVLGSLKRRKALFALTFAAVVGLSYLVYWIMPRSYHVETQLLAQKNLVIGQLAAGRAVSDWSPTRAAAEMVLRRDNLVALVQSANLLGTWDQSRSRASQAKAWLRAKLGGAPLAEEDKLEIIVGTLETALKVETKTDYQGEGTVNIAGDWPDAKTAYRLVTAAQQSFTDARQLLETSSISDAMAILFARATSMRKEIDVTMAAIEERKLQQRGGVVRRRGGGLRLPRGLGEPALSATERENLQQIQALWDAKKAAIKDLDDTRRHRLNELQTKLLELRATYAESHPSIVDLTQTIETLKEDSPQVAQLRKEEAALHAQYLARLPKASDAPSAETAIKPITHDTAVQATLEPASDDDNELTFAKSQLRQQAEQYDRVLDRIEGARMELETARAASKYRYVVLHPAQVPRDPLKPKASKIIGGGVAVALLLAILAALLADLRSGRAYAPWQLEHALRLPVLAEIPRQR